MRSHISTTQVISYLKALCNSYLINKVGRIEINGIKKFEVGDKIKDNYPKYVVSLDDFNKGSDIQVIKHMHLSDFLMLEIL